MFLKYIESHYIDVCSLELLFRQITTFVKVRKPFVVRLQILLLIDFSKIYQWKGLEPKNKGQTNFYERCDLTKKYIYCTFNLWQKNPNLLESHQKDWHGFTIWFTSALCCLAQMCKANTHICQVKIKKKRENLKNIGHMKKKILSIFKQRYILF